MKKIVLDTRTKELVDFIMVTDDGTLVSNTVTLEKAEEMLRGGEVRETKNIPGFPLTCDGKYFFSGRIETGKTKKSSGKEGAENDGAHGSD